ncbi:helix-turn-helix domain-containing protein [Chryseobacterium sp. NFX27]|uniref:helix-turn-helix domain-containing protein n=1 Tax=Chryseobacterium sp. NFX27 TaxID=2819618 RepID=UPI003CEDEBB9
MKKQLPDYHRIYNDIIEKRHPEKRDICHFLLKKKKLSFLDVIKLNTLIFGENSAEGNNINQKYRSYNETIIQEILEFQSKNKLNNTQLGNYYKLSRNTIAKWRKIYSQS